MTPKVGPHVSYGFAAGSLFGEKASLVMPGGLIRGDNPAMEVMTALSGKGDVLYVIILNQSPEEQGGAFTLDLGKLAGGSKLHWTGERVLQGKMPEVQRAAGKLSCRLPGWGIEVVGIQLGRYE
jgi:hypothetical protein